MVWLSYLWDEVVGLWIMVEVGMLETNPLG